MKPSPPSPSEIALARGRRGKMSLSRSHPHLSPLEVLSIKRRLREGASLKELSSIFRVHVKTLKDIRRGHTWKRLKEGMEFPSFLHSSSSSF